MSKPFRPHGMTLPIDLVYHHEGRHSHAVEISGGRGCGRGARGAQRREPEPLVFESLYDASVAAPEADVTAEGDLSRLIAALHSDGTLIERLASHLHDTESALGAFELVKELVFDLMLEDLFYAAKERTFLLAERVEVPTVRREARRRVHDLLAQGVTLVTLEFFVNWQSNSTSYIGKAGPSRPAPRWQNGSTHPTVLTRGCINFSRRMLRGS